MKRKRKNRMKWTKKTRQMGKKVKRRNRFLALIRQNRQALWILQVKNRVISCPVRTKGGLDRNRDPSPEIDIEEGLRRGEDPGAEVRLVNQGVGAQGGLGVEVRPGNQETVVQDIATAVQIDVGGREVLTNEGKP